VAWSACEAVQRHALLNAVNDALESTERAGARLYLFHKNQERLLEGASTLPIGAVDAIRVVICATHLVTPKDAPVC